MTAYAYYPGCSLHGTAREYASSTEGVCHALGVELAELDDWSCCGASSAHATNPWLGHGLVARNLRLAGATGLKDLVLPCAACYARFKETVHALHDSGSAATIEEVAGGEVPRDLAIESLLAVLSQPAHLETLRASVVRPLTGIRVAPYYGCLLTRPAAIAEFDDPEDPQGQMRRAGRGDHAMPVYYFTELMGVALGLAPSGLGISKHLTDAAKLLERVPAGAEG
jgi:heterodisulfide reductase subunit B